MKADSYRFDGSVKCRLDKLATNSKADGVDKEKILAKTAENLQKMAALQDAFYADGREGLIFVLQAMDAAGKDSTIKHVMSGLNPQGVQVTSFKQPNSEELKHDFLWRVNKALPRVCWSRTRTSFSPSATARSAITSSIFMRTATAW